MWKRLLLLLGAVCTLLVAYVVSYLVLMTDTPAVDEKDTVVYGSSYRFGDSLHLNIGYSWYMPKEHCLNKVYVPLDRLWGRTNVGGSAVDYVIQEIYRQNEETAREKWLFRPLYYGNGQQMRNAALGLWNDRQPCVAGALDDTLYLFWFAKSGGWTRTLVEEEWNPRESDADGANLVLLSLGSGQPVHLIYQVQHDSPEGRQGGDFLDAVVGPDGSLVSRTVVWQPLAEEVCTAFDAACSDGGLCHFVGVVRRTTLEGQVWELVHKARDSGAESRVALREEARSPTVAVGRVGEAMCLYQDSRGVHARILSDPKGGEVLALPGGELRSRLVAGRTGGYYALVSMPGHPGEIWCLEWDGQTWASTMAGKTTLPSEGSLAIDGEGALYAVWPEAEGLVLARRRAGMSQWRSELTVPAEDPHWQGDRFSRPQLLVDRKKQLRLVVVSLSKSPLRTGDDAGLWYAITTRYAADVQGQAAAPKP